MCCAASSDAPLHRSLHPSGADEYVASTKRETQQRLLTRIPDVPDLQAAWPLLHFCAAPRANYLLRNVPRALTAQVAADHDAAVATCLGSLVHCAYWASWLDTLPAIQARSGQIAAHLRRALAAPHASGSTAVAAAAQAATHLAAQGCAVPSGAARSLLLHGLPYARMKQSPSRPQRSAEFRVLLLRRLRLPLPLAPRVCACRGLLDPLGDHRAACANSGTLASRALPLERAVARVCQEAGARVARNMRLADMNLPVPVADSRRIEIVCNGLPLGHGVQLAVDTICVSPVTRSGEPRPGADSQPGLALQLATRRKRRETYPELSRSPRCRLHRVFAVETGGRWGRTRRERARCRPLGSACSLRVPLEWHHRRGSAEGPCQLPSRAPPRGSCCRCRRTGSA